MAKKKKNKKKTPTNVAPRKRKLSKRDKYVRFIVYLMIISMLLSVFIAGATMFL